MGIKKQRQHFANKGPSSQSYGFSGSRVWIWELDHKEVWALKNWCFQTVVLEKTLESSLDSKEVKPVHPKGNHPWIFTGRTDAKAEASILWPPDEKSHESPDLNWPVPGKSPWFSERLKAEGEVAEGERRREWDGLDSITESMEMSLVKLQEIVKGREDWHAAVHGVVK